MVSRYASFMRARNFAESNVNLLSEKIKRFCDPVVKKCEGTVIGRAGTFLKNVAIDYKEVFVETYNSTKANPKNMAVYLGVFGLGAWCVALNPDEASFRDELIRNEHRIMLLSENVRNPLPVSETTKMEQYLNEGRIRRFSLGLLSFIWLDDYDKGIALYDAHCDYLKPSLLSYPNRILDVGFLGRWWLLSKCMNDYDVNPEEFQ